MVVECTIKDDFVLIYGECNTKAELDYETIALNEIKRIGYTEEYHVHTVVNQQSPEIHNAVNRDEVCALVTKVLCLVMHVMKMMNTCH